MTQTLVGQLRARARRLLGRPPPPEPRFELPELARKDEAYFRALLQSIESPDSRIYVDTSVLMWLTQVGAGARVQFEKWIEAKAKGRYFVPVWAAHELQTHLSQGRLVESLGECTKALEKTGADLYPDLHPFLQVPLEPAADIDEQQIEFLEALAKVRQLAVRLGKWKDSYADSVAAVRTWVNTHSARGSNALHHAVAVANSGPPRYDSRVPPGFQDRNKKERQVESKEDNVTQGSNKWGDLIFWMEVVELTRKSKAKTVVVLTNDRKNDWRMPGSDGANVHPMLAFEAAIEAGAREVKLVDVATLAHALKETSEPDTESLRRAALTPPVPRPVTPKQAERAYRKEKGRAASTTSMGTTAASTDAGVDELQSMQIRPPKIDWGPITMRTAIQASGRLSLRATPVAEAVVGRLVGPGDLVEALESANFAEFDAKDLVSLGRNLHDKVNTDPGVLAPALLELVSTLSSINHDLSVCLLAGLLASAYLEPGSSTPRSVPLSPVLQQLFERLAEPFAERAVTNLVAVLRAKKAELLYWPNIHPVPLEFEISTREDGDVVRVDGVMVGGMQLYEPAQGHERLQLVTLVGAEIATPDELCVVVCRVYGIPRGALGQPEFGAERLTLQPTDGLVDPTRVFQQQGNDL
jgi:PIN like domain